MWGNLLLFILADGIKKDKVDFFLPPLEYAVLNKQMLKVDLINCTPLCFWNENVLEVSREMTVMTVGC